MSETAPQDPNRKPPLRENLARAMYHGGVEIRDAYPGGMPTLVGHFAVFNTWAEINSVREGRFLERISPGSFRKTFEGRLGKIKVLFQHGKDPQIAEKPIGVIESLAEDDIGAAYVVRLLDTNYVHDLIPGLRENVYGASFLFRMMRWEEVEYPARSPHNPQGLLERTLQELYVHEFSPVTWGAYENATAGIRSLTDVLHDVETVAAATPIILDEERVGRARAFITGDTSEGVVLREKERSYDRIIQYVAETAWAIHPRYLSTILQIVGERSRGHRPTAQELRSRIGDGYQQRSAMPDGPVAVIPISGAIVPRASMMENTSEEGTSIEGLQKQFRAAMANPDVKAVLFDVESPGGSVDMVPEFAAEILAARGTKPITAIANTWAASAAYLLASQADELLVSPSGEVGSIGVYSAHQDLSGQQQQQGVKTTLVHAGEHKVEGNPYEPLSEEAQAQMQSKVDAYYEMFVQAVADGRGVTAEDVKSGYGQGRMLMAKDAVAKGMADGVATYDETLRRLTSEHMSDTTSSDTSATIQVEEDAATSSDAPPLGDAEPTEAHLSHGRRDKSDHTAPKWWRDRDEKEVPSSWREP